MFGMEITEHYKQSIIAIMKEMGVEVDHSKITVNFCKNAKDGDLTTNALFLLKKG